jgi:hypothetical protein
MYPTLFSSVLLLLLLSYKKDLTTYCNTHREHNKDVAY